MGAGRVAAIVSRVSLADFSGEVADENTQNPEWVVPRACRHQHVVQAVMERSPVLPVRFGAVFSSGRRLEDLLRDKGEQIVGFLDWVSGKEEWAVKGMVDFDRAAAWLRASDPALAEQHDHLSESPGARYFQERRLRVAAQERLKPWCRAIAGQVQQQLDADAVDARPLRLLALGVPGKGAQMVFHRAFLLPRERVAEFLARVERVGADRAGQGLALAASGPWPPYTFSPPLWEALG
jgi:FAD/FMN-containing dehydrogenase